MLHAAPCNVRHMNKAIYAAAYINESAKIGQPADNALYLGANFKLRPTLLAGSLSLGNHNGLVRSNDALTGLVNFNYLEGYGLAYQILYLFNLLGGKLRSGNESAHTLYGGYKAALDNLLAYAFEHLIGDVLVLHQAVPHLLAFNILV